MISVKSITVEALFGRIDLHAEFNSGMTTIYGKNGSAKTTILHIIANVLTKDIARFSFLDFKFIRLILSDESKIELKSTWNVIDTAGEPTREIEVLLNNERVVQPFDSYRVMKEMSFTDDDEEQSELMQRVLTESQSLPNIPVTYFPAFRTTLEAAHGSAEELTAIRNARGHFTPRARRPRRYRSRRHYVTALARSLFGPFVPSIDYPSTLIIAEELSEKLNEANFNLARKDSQMLADTFGEVFDIIREGGDSSIKEPDEVLDQIKDLLMKLDPEASNRFNPRAHTVFSRLRASVDQYDGNSPINEHLTPIMQVYRDSLQERLDEEVRQFREIEVYVQAVNRFLEDKSLTFEPLRGPFPQAVIKMAEGNNADLLALSSGERQVVSLLFATIFEPQSKNSVVLIDEPEISLHIDWQRLLVQQIAEYLKNCQLVVCTHSPEVVGAFDDDPVEIKPRTTKYPVPTHRIPDYFDDDVPF